MSAPNVILELDHSLAHSRGGGDTEENLVTSCIDCNRGKSADLIVVKANPIVGMAFHFFKDGRLRKQGAIESVSAKQVGVVYFSWITGYENDYGNILLKDLLGSDYVLYLSEFEMQQAFDGMNDPIGLVRSASGID